MSDSENQSEDKIMKKSLGVSAAIAVVFGSLLPGRAAACDNVCVRSMNGAPSAVTEGLTMNSTPADSLGFSLASSGKPRESAGVEFIVKPSVTAEGAPFIDLTKTLSQAAALPGSKLPNTTAIAAETPSDFFMILSSD